MKVIILAAGFGTRLYPLTKNRPKALLEMAGKTLLDHFLEKLEGFQRICEIIIVTNGLFYVDFFRWRKESHYRKLIRIVDNQICVPEMRSGEVRDLYLGVTTNPAPGEDYLVFCSDNLFDYPLSHFLLSCLSHPDSGFVGVYNVKDLESASKFGVVELDAQAKIIHFEEKPVKPMSTHISIGVYYFPNYLQSRLHEYLEIEQLNPDKIGDFVAWLAKKLPLYGVEFEGKWLDIGDPQAYKNAKAFFESKSFERRSNKT